MTSDVASASELTISESETRGGTLAALLASEPNARRWLEHPSSTIVHHERGCCEEARLWLLSYARSMQSRAGSRIDVHAPVWLSRLFEWGPSAWPISWCQVVREKMIDCGVFAALAREVFRAQGLAVHPALALLAYNSTCTDHWKRYWNGHKESKRCQGERDIFPWIGNEVVYHELCVIEQADGTARFYDSTWGHWYLPEPRVGFNSLLAVRSECARLLRWDRHALSCGEWVVL